MTLNAKLRTTLGEPGAAALARDALSRIAETFGPDHRRAGEAMLVLAQALEADGDLDAALTAATQAATILEAALGPDHESCARARSLVARLGSP